MTLFRSIAPVALVAVLVSILAACNPTTNIRITGDKPLKHLTIEDERVGLRSSEGDMAWIEADGSLEIQGRPVPLEAPQRSLTTRFYTEARHVHQDGIAIGESGAAMARKSVRSVIRGLTRGHPEQIGSEIEAEARELETHAMRLCARIGTLQSVQDELAATVPQFQPYASIKTTGTDACTVRTRKRDGGTVGEDAAATAGQI